MWRALCLLGTLNYVMSMGLPEYIKPCSRNDPNLNDCAVKSGREALYRYSLGDESRGLKPLDPLSIAQMTVFVPNENGLKLVFKDNVFTGLSHLQLNGLKFNFDKKLITVDSLVNLDVKNTYDLSGRILVVPIRSNGDATIKLKNTTLHTRFWYEHVEGNDGKIHWKIIKHDFKYEIEKAIFRLENLLGDKTVGDQINRMLNELWREIIADVGPIISQNLGSAVVENLAVFLEQVSYDELFPE